MPDRSDHERLLDILEEAAVIERAISGIAFDTFSSDALLQRGVLHALQTIGEAANYLSDASMTQIADVPWPAIRGMRNRIVHGYFGLDMMAVWRTAKEDVPALTAAIQNSGLV